MLVQITADGPACGHQLVVKSVKYSRIPAYTATTNRFAARDWEPPPPPCRFHVNSALVESHGVRAFDLPYVYAHATDVQVSS